MRGEERRGEKLTIEHKQNVNKALLKNQSEVTTVPSCWHLNEREREKHTKQKTTRQLTCGKTVALWCSV